MGYKIKLSDGTVLIGTLKEFCWKGTDVVAQQITFAAQGESEFDFWGVQSYNHANGAQNEGWGFGLVSIPNDHVLAPLGRMGNGALSEVIETPLEITAQWENVPEIPNTVNVLFDTAHIHNSRKEDANYVIEHAYLNAVALTKGSKGKTLVKTGVDDYGRDSFTLVDEADVRKIEVVARFAITSHLSEDEIMSIFRKAISEADENVEVGYVLKH